MPIKEPQRGDYPDDLSHARASQLWSAEQLRAGHPMARRGLTDWFDEELEIEREAVVS